MPLVELKAHTSEIMPVFRQWYHSVGSCSDMLRHVKTSFDSLRLGFSFRGYHSTRLRARTMPPQRPSPGAKAEAESRLFHAGFMGAQKGLWPLVATCGRGHPEVPKHNWERRLLRCRCDSDTINMWRVRRSQASMERRQLWPRRICRKSPPRASMQTSARVRQRWRQRALLAPLSKVSTRHTSTVTVLFATNCHCLRVRSGHESLENRAPLDRPEEQALGS